MSEFGGFKREAIQFLADLAANNDRAWFQPRKADYERLLKEPMEELCLALADRFKALGVPLEADPKRSPFRIYRDTRFSKDKSPYKAHVSASFPWVGSTKQAHGDGAYFHFQPTEMFMGGGMWHAEKPRLDAFRAAVLRNPRRSVPRSRTRASRRSSARSRQRTLSSACRLAIQLTARWPTCSAGRTSSLASACQTRRCCPRSCPTRSPPDMPRPCPH
jgi:uncharacterized protein (DUF2461 family)